MVNHDTRLAGRGSNAISLSMSEEALSAAATRLERAVARLEQAAGKREDAGSTIATAYAQLEDRHEVLRARVQETISRLDTLIAQGTR